MFSENIKKPSYSIVLVNYKSYQLTSICLGLLHKALNGSDAQVWVVDNDSRDESTDYLRSLDWINFVERSPVENEKGFMSHGLALDMVLERVETDYLFLLHTDTLIYDPVIFDIMLNKCAEDESVVAAGCVEQIYRGRTRIIWRLITRFIKHYFRRLKLVLRMKSKQPKPYYEMHLKSFCALWDIKVMKKHGLTFQMSDRTPGYEAQDRLKSLGYNIAYIPVKKMFRYLDHVESGTVSAQGHYGKDHRRTKKYNSFMDKMKEHNVEHQDIK